MISSTTRKFYTGQIARHATKAFATVSIQLIIMVLTIVSLLPQFWCVT